MKRFSVWLLSALSAIGLLAAACGAEEHKAAAPPPPNAAEAPRALPQSPGQMQLSFAPLVKKATPAVVNIYTKRIVRESPFAGDPFFQRFFQGTPFGMPRERVQGALGSGVIVRADGYIITNHHVIDGASEIVVALADKREFPAKLVIDDPRTDLALLKIEDSAEQLPFLELGDSDALQVGDLVLAIGNPFGVGQTVTSGIVSALARTQIGASDYQFFIQTDAAINPGNSGGALLSMDGRVIGINSAIYSQSGGSIGIGFAIPSNMVRTVLASANAGGKTVVRPWLGAIGQEVTPDLAQSLKLAHPGGVLVDSVYPGSPAATAGLKAGDVIVRVGRNDVSDPESLRFRIGTQPMNGVAQVGVLRDGEFVTLPVKLTPAPETPPRDETQLKGNQPLVGVTVANLSPALAEERSLPVSQTGVIVTAIANGAPLAGTLQPNDQIVSVNDHKITSVRQLSALMSGTRGWVIQCRRGGQMFTLQFRG